MFRRAWSDHDVSDPGVRFNLKAANGEIIATSEAYEAKASALNGVESVRKNARIAGMGTRRF